MTKRCKELLKCTFSIKRIKSIKPMKPRNKIKNGSYKYFHLSFYSVTGNVASFPM